MSKRFGRNQKRRMRQQIAEAENKVIAAGKSIQEKINLLVSERMNRDYLEVQIRTLAGEIDRAKEILGHEFIGFKLTDQVRMHLDHGRERFNYFPKTGQPVTPCIGGYSYEAIKTLPLDVIAASVDRDIYREAIHVTVTVGPEMKVCAAIAGAAARNIMPPRDMARTFVDYIKHDILTQLEQLKARR